MGIRVNWLRARQTHGPVLARVSMAVRSSVPQGTPFQMAVWAALLRIPCGEVRTYSDLAAEVGRPTAVRAVANACGANPDAPRVPCHRVVRSDGGLGGYSGEGGVATKRRLLAEEGVDVAALGA